MSLHVKAADFEKEVLKADIPVLVDFWAEWCMPCRMVSPILDELAEEYAGKLKVVKVNVDEEPDLASRFGIVSIPTILLFKNGQVAAQQIGAAPRQVFEQMIQPHLG
ncbi:thioredoxin [Spirochaeta thermophila DSM 6578]|uniref:Thioredoxin n=1 Tax=Winmispira thermophila (strain ATCC 700085 / DSM 6578 / Z-1203) TaxID=869211 RepID=G0GCN8_WINT7|nr:thioredoxin [Spirochaeta thermophila]AEJ60457.1 thioredoxin [Spirochaeta thermophila DSM 6578]